MKRMTLAYAYTDRAGKTHAPGDTIDVDLAEAAHLLHYGLAQEAPADNKKKG